MILHEHHRDRLAGLLVSVDRRVGQLSALRAAVLARAGA
jgi:hypothetical protein